MDILAEMSERPEVSHTLSTRSKDEILVLARDGLADTSFDFTEL